MSMRNIALLSVNVDCDVMDKASTETELSKPNATGVLSAGEICQSLTVVNQMSRKGFM